MGSRFCFSLATASAPRASAQRYIRLAGSSTAASSLSSRLPPSKLTRAPARADVRCTAGDKELSWSRQDESRGKKPWPQAGQW